MKNSITIPVAFQIRLDDVGWHNGSDDRYCSRPSRTGLPRLHHALDYPVIHELGKALGMQINCAIVLGEWDKDNLLRGEKYLTWDPEGWDRASEMDMVYHEKAFEALESSEYISYTVHGVLHGHYDNGLQVTEREFYTRKRDPVTGEYTKEYTWFPDSEFRRHLDFFFKLYDSWGFKKTIRSFSCGNGNIGSQFDEGNIRYAGILKEYGIDIWPNGWTGMIGGTTAVLDGMVALSSKPEGIPWNAYDVDPDYLKLFNTETLRRTDFGIHWPNLLRWNPEHNLERLSKWVDFFHRQAEVFGSMMSKNNYFAASQAVYSRYAKLQFEGNKCVIDLSDVDAQNARAQKDEFYISFRGGFAPKGITGGAISEYETKKTFKTYKITRDGSDKVIITL